MTTMRPDDALRIDTSTNGTIRIAGDLDAATAPRLRPVLTAALDTGADRLILDVSDLTFCDSTGLAVLIRARNALPAHRQLILHVACDQLRRLLAITQLDTTFTLT